MALKNEKKKQNKQSSGGKKNGHDKTARNSDKKQNNQNKSHSCCKWMFGSFILLTAIALVLIYDTSVNGNGVFAKSAVGKKLEDFGVLPHVEKAWYTTMGAGARAYKWGEKNIPPYSKPAFDLTCDLLKLGRNAIYNIVGTLGDFLQQKYPIAANYVDQYLPGFPEKVENGMIAVKKVLIDVADKTVHFFKTQILIGRFSTENLSKALNNTQNAAVEYYNLFHQKVDAYAKLK